MSMVHQFYLNWESVNSLRNYFELGYTSDNEQRRQWPPVQRIH